MKNYILFFCITLLTSNLYAQTNGWQQYSQPKKIYDMQYDSAGNLHCGTDMGYVKLDNMLTVVAFKNLTSQDVPVGKLKQVALDPSNDDFFYGVDDDEKIASFNLDNGNIEYPTFNATLEEYRNTQLYWASNNEMYVFSKEKKYYQTVNNGVLSPKKDVDFYPQSIVENSDHTKAYFAGINNGLWELDKATTNWTNYNMQNSAIHSNGLTDLEIDSNNVLYISSYAGLCTLTNGTFANYEEPIPGGTINYPCFQVDVHPNTDKVLVRTSLNNSASHSGFATVDLTTNTWNFYAEDNTNCVNKNTFDHVNYSSDGSKILAIEPFGGYYSASNTVFDPVINSCNPINFNYLNASELSQYSDINVRSSKDTNAPNNKFEIGFTNNDGFSIQELPIIVTGNDFAAYNNSEIIIPNNNGEVQYDVLSTKNYFLITNNKNEIQFVDDDNNITKQQLTGIGSGGIIKAKTAGSIANHYQPIVLSTYNNGAERKFDIINCDLENSTCTPGTEVFTNDRNVTANATFNCTEKSDTELLCGILKENATDEITAELINYNISAKSSVILLTKVVSHLISQINREINFLETSPEDETNNPKAHFSSHERKQLNRIENVNNEPVITEFTIDVNQDGKVDSVDEAIAGNIFIKGRDLDPDIPFDFLKAIFLYLERVNTTGNGTSERVRQKFADVIAYREGNTANKNSTTTEIPYSAITESEIKDLPQDLIIYKTIRYFNSTQNYTLLLNTNYGLLHKSGITINDVLSISENTISENNISVYPNPSTNALKVTGVTAKKLTLLDINGRKITSTNGNQLKFSNVSKGMYVLKIETEKNSIITKKIIIQ
ncbi:T9SS type A sorting domain-containing protein [Polaribacter sp.]|uniref:T9SS type A sorting domain-containing protein n=1 Tax=Polaribacter sp. TaxID=1920175 RepID=UPI003EF8165B